ncbi:MAG: RNA polymerase sigma factor FliA [Thermodesulfobacteriota bacterium]|nr:RNA polymerase sigma factor FliA [Thermodesulfobacteriota bacterium]
MHSYQNHLVLDKEVIRYAPLVKRIASHMASRLPPNIETEDLIQSGMVGLLKALGKHDPSRGASFETYAGIRIRGAMIDEIRKSDWTPRSLHRKVKRIAEAIKKIENQTGREATDTEVAETLKISLEEYYRILQDVNGASIFSFNSGDGPDYIPEDSFRENTQGPHNQLYFNEMKRAMTKTLSDLPERERLVISLYYNEELNLLEIGKVLGVSESRVCQIRNHALLRLRARMSDWMD